VNGVPSCANGRLNNHVLRDMHNFDGYVVSDCGGVSCIMDAHKYTSTVEDTCAAALQGGCDLDCGGLLGKCSPTRGG
jgi:beta-glucosidase-like glycosyl hydrolase